MMAADSGFRPGDVITAVGRFRITVGALAEIIELFEADSPAALAESLRQITPKQGRGLLAALLRPFGQSERADRVSDAEVAALMPDMARCITTAFAGPT